MNKREKQQEDSMRIITWAFIGAMTLLMFIFVCKGALFLIDYFFPPK